jgi:acetyltransferase-like isoleucine patch superfamily enzyme
MIKDQKRFGTAWDKRSTFLTYIILMLWLIRGAFRRLWFKSSKGILLIGRQVRIRSPHKLAVGRNFILEDSCELNCNSLRGMNFGDNVTIGSKAIIRPSNIYGGAIGEGLVIGNNSNIGPYSYIGCSGLITIGNNVMISPRVSIYAENHNFDDAELAMKEQGVTRESVTIQDDCWIASNSIILAGVTIGTGSVIGAGSVVTKDIPAFSIVAGNPARIIKSRLS